MFGEHGEAIMNGGLTTISGIMGPGNSYKSTTMDFQNLSVLNRYEQSHYAIYDAEGTKSIARTEELAKGFNKIGGQDLVSSGRISMTDLTVYNGEGWWQQWLEFCTARGKKPKDQMGTTPFLTRSGELFRDLYPMLAFCDSFSAIPLDALENLYDKNEVGSSETNMADMTAGRIKNQMLSQMPRTTAMGSLYLSLSAHIGTKVETDKYNATPKALGALKKNQHIKGVPGKFTFYTGNCWLVNGTETLLNKGTGCSEFPRNQNDNLKADQDLQRVTITNARAKQGQTGFIFDLILSQRDGIHVGLTEFWYCRLHNRYGMAANTQNYYLELRPDVSLSRTTIRGKWESDLLLRRAMEITSEMCQIRNHGVYLGHEHYQHICTPAELYASLKEKGYDWDVLLDTRGYWVFKESEANEKPFLSTLDLIRMHEGKYHPWWMPKPKGVKEETIKAA